MSDKNWQTVYFKNPENGVVTEHGMYAIDARDAARRYPDQYRLTPWVEEKPVDPAPKQPEHPARPKG